MVRYIQADRDSAHHAGYTYIYFIESQIFLSGYYQLRGTLNMPRSRYNKKYIPSARYRF